jgi:hypothetical protein
MKRMGDVLDMITKKPRKFDCQGENVDDTLERRISAAGAFARFMKTVRDDFGDRFAMEILKNEEYRLKMGGKP